jgi:hypothetical protein
LSTGRAREFTPILLNPKHYTHDPNNFQLRILNTESEILNPEPCNKEGGVVNAEDVFDKLRMAKEHYIRVGL